MPIKYNLTKYDMLSTRIKKVSVKKSPKELSLEERKTMIKAILIASFASGHSWQTYRTLTSQVSASMHSPEIRKEYQETVASKWKLITPFDIVEVSTTNIPDNAFSEWLFFNVEKNNHQEYKHAWSELKADFNEDCDVVEKTELHPQ
jgi:hypothetical protein